MVVRAVRGLVMAVALMSSCSSGGLGDRAVRDSVGGPSSSSSSAAVQGSKAWHGLAVTTLREVLADLRPA